MEQIFNFDYIVVGAGVFGLSTAYFLSEHHPQLQICLVQQFDIGHDHGSSHSKTRIIRSTYKKQFYRDLCVLGINEYWPQMEKKLDQKFILPNECVTFVEKKESYEQIKQTALSSKGQLQLISYDELRKRYPFAPNIKSKFMNCIDTKAGVIQAQNYIKALTNFVRNKLNLKVFQNFKLLSINNKAQNVEIKIISSQNAQKKTLRGKKIILSCGRWIGSLIPQMKKLIKVARQTVGFWEMKNMQNYQTGKFPCWIHELPNGQQYYGLPDAGGIGIKYAKHSQTGDIEQKFKSENQYLQACVKDLRQKSIQYFGDQTVKLNKIEKCYYTVTKTEDFILDWSDQKENILICSTCSGHGFKFGPVLGKIASDLLIYNKSVDIFQKFRYMLRIGYHQGVNLQ